MWVAQGEHHELLQNLLFQNKEISCNILDLTNAMQNKL